MANVICPMCGESYHETTDKYRPDVSTTADMLSLKPQYRANGWSSFAEDVATASGDIYCPDCLGMYLENGKVRTDEPVVITDDPVVTDVVIEPRRPGRPKKV